MTHRTIIGMVGAFTVAISLALAGGSSAAPPPPDGNAQPHGGADCMTMMSAGAGDEAGTMHDSTEPGASGHDHMMEMARRMGDGDMTLGMQRMMEMMHGGMKHGHGGGTPDRQR